MAPHGNDRDLANGKELTKVLLSLTNLFQHLKKRWLRLSGIAMIVALVAGGLMLTRPVSYTVTASFRDEEIATPDVSLNSGMLSFDPKDERKRIGEEEERIPAQVVMRSRTILQPLIRDLHMQGVVVPIRKGLHAKLNRIVDKVQTRATKNLTAELAKRRKPGAVVLPDPKRLVECIDIDYDGEATHSFTVAFMDDLHYTVTDPSGRTVGFGVLGTPFAGDDVTFTLRQTGRTQLRKKRFEVTILAMQPLVEWLSRAIKIYPDSADDQVLHLSFRGRDRRRSSRVLNRLMHLYQQHLLADVRGKAEQKLAYLEARRKEMLHEMEAFLNSREDAFTRGVGAERYLDYNTQVKLLGERQEEAKEQKSLLERRLAALYSYQNEKAPLVSDVVKAIPDLRVPLEKMRGLRQQRDSLRLDLEEVATADIGTTADSLEKAQARIDALSHGLLAESAQGLRSVAATHSTHTRSMPFVQFIDGLCRLEKLRASALEQAMRHPATPAPEFDGFNLDMANKLYVDQTKLLDSLSETIGRYQYAVDNLADAEFSIASLSGHLKDDFSQGIIETGSTMAAKLANEGHYTAKELRHFKRYHDKQKEILAGHTEQRLQVLKGDRTAIEQKVRRLQQTMVELINQEIAVLDQQVCDAVESEVEALEQQLLFREEEIERIEVSLAELPEKWAAEQEWTMQADIFGQMSKALTEMVEAMSMSCRMQVVNSGPIDLAVPPLAPTDPKVFKMTVVGGILGFLLACTASLVLAFSRGFSTTPFNLSALGGQVFGEVVDRRGRAIDDTLRKLLGYVSDTAQPEKGARRLLLQIGDGVDISRDLAMLLAKQGEKVLVVDLPTRGESEKMEGLLYYLEHGKRAPSPKAEGDYSVLTAGGKSPYVVELLASQRFSKLMARMSKEYDWIVLVSKAPVDSPEVDRVLGTASAIAVCVTEEHLPQIWKLLENPGMPVGFAFSRSAPRPSRTMAAWQRIRRAYEEARQEC